MASYNTTAKVVLSVNGRQAQQVLSSLQQEATKLKKKLERAGRAGDKASMRKLQRELSSTNRMIQQLQGSANTAEEVLRRMDKASPKELQKTLRTLQQQMNGIERGSAAWNAHVAKIKAVKQELQAINRQMALQQSGWDRMNNWLNNAQTFILGLTAAVTGLVMAARKAVSAYADMEEELANTRKYTGMTEQNVLKLNDAFLKMDTRTGRDKLNELAQEAGRLGKNTLESVQGYVEAADIINVALVDLGEGATQTIAKISNIFGVEQQLGTKEAMLSIGSAVNVLSQNCTASKPYLVEFAQRMAGIGAQAGLSVPEILAFGAVLDANGQKVEMSSTAIQKVLMKLASKNGEFARTLGMDAQKLNETLKHSAKDGLMMFLEQLHAIGEKGGYENATMTLAPAFAELGLDAARVSMVLSTLAKHIDEVKWQINNANKAFTEATSATNEYNIFNNTVQAGLDKAKKHIQELAIELGRKLLPVMKYVMRSSTAFMKLLNAMVDFIIEHRVAILSLVSAFVAYNAAVAVATMRTKAHAAMTAVVKLAQEAWIATQALATAAVSLFSGKVTAATQSFRIFATTLKANPLGLLVAAITAAVTALVMLTRRMGEAEIAEKALGDIREQAAIKVAEETSRLKALIAVAQDETRSMKERKEACLELNKIIPDYNAQIDQTTGRYIASTAALDKYNEALKRKFELEGAKEQLRELGKEKAKLAVQLTKDEEALKQAREQQAREASVTSGNYNYSTTGGAAPPAVVNITASNSANVAGAERKRNSTRRKMRDIKVSENAILGVYGDDIANEKAATPSTTVEELNAAAGAAPSVAADGGKNSDNSDATADRFKLEKEWREREEALNRIAYARGEKNYEEYTGRMDEISVEFHKRQLEHTELSENERLTIQAEYQEALKKQREDGAKATIEQENDAYAESLAQEKQRFADGKVDYATYQESLQQMELAHLRKMVAITALGSKERVEAEKKYLDRLVADQRKKQKEAEDAEKKHEQELKRIKDRVFGNNPQENKAAYDAALSNLTEVYNAELMAAGDNAEEKLRIEKAFQEAKLALQRQYGQIAEVDARNAMARAIGKSVEWLESDGGKAMQGAVSTLTSGMTAIFSGLSSLVQAELEIETAAIEKRYEKEIAAAEGNSYRVKMLEQRKEKEIARAKNEANRKMFAMQVIQAVAQTAQNAISAYGSAAAIPLVGYILAPIAAGMAVAAGAIQIAAIKKQQQASMAQGYAEGGFTPEGPADEPVGIVHAGEWVASQKLVRSPRTRPLIEALEYAQRNNAIGTMNAEDVSRSITAPMRLASKSALPVQPNVVVNVPAQASDSPKIAQTLDRLNERLNEPFVTVATVSGDKGINRAQEEYERLLRNKSPKSRKQ